MPLAGNREPLLSWRRLCFCLLGLLAIIFLFNTVPSSVYRSDRTSSQHTSPPLQSYLHTFGNPEANNEAIDGLSEAQCTATFPRLYDDIERAVAYWRAKGHTIGAQDVTINSTGAAMRILIHENEMRILESTRAVDRLLASPDRALGVLHLIQRALDAAMAAGERLPTVEAAINFQDDADPPREEEDTHSYWTFARTIGKEAHQRLWLFPNFDFWYYHPTGSFGDAKRSAMLHDAPFASKIPKVVWRGNPTFNAESRGALIDKTKGKDWADVKSVQWVEDPPVSLPVDEFCKYAMTVYTEGVTYSGRLKFLMNCNSLLLVPQTKYMTHYSHLLQPDGTDQNYVPVKADWSDLEFNVKEYLADAHRSERVIANSLATFRSKYTTRAATSCYIRRLIQKYGSVAYTPDVHVRAIDGRSMGLRGQSYEKFMDSPADMNYELAS